MNKRLSLAVLMLSLAIPGAAGAEVLEVRLGYSEIIGPVANMSTVIVGDERVADATLGGGGTIILTGRLLGATNLIVLDESGRELLASPLHVVPLDRRPTTQVRIFKGAAEAQDYVCGPGPGCSPVDGQGEPAIMVAEPAATPELPAAPATGDPAAEEQISLNP